MACRWVMGIVFFWVGTFLVGDASQGWAKVGFGFFLVAAIFLDALLAGLCSGDSEVVDFAPPFEEVFRDANDAKEPDDFPGPPMEGSVSSRVPLSGLSLDWPTKLA